MNLQRIREALGRAREDERGASAVEYGLLVAAIAAIIIIIVFTLGKYVHGAFSSTCSTFQSQLTNPPAGSCT